MRGLWALSLALLAAPALAGGPRMSAPQVSGYLKHFAIASDPPAIVGTAGGGPVQGLATSRLRLRGSVDRGPLYVEAAWEVAPLVQPEGGLSDGGELPRPAAAAYRVTDVRRRLHPWSGGPAGAFEVHQNLDRLLLSWTAPRGDVIVGRQPIAFGSARVVSPTDVLTPFAYEALDRDERPGVDAVRLRLPVGALGELDAGWVLGHDFEARHGAVYLRGRGHLRGLDAGGLVGRIRRHWLLGLDLARAVGDAGAWLEAARVRAHGARDYTRLSAGVDRNLTRDVFGFVEYHYNGAGGDDPSTYVSRAHATAFADGGVFLLGRHYLAPAVLWQVSGLLSLTVQSLVNLDDHSWLAGPRSEYSITEDVYAELGAFVGVGSGLSSWVIAPPWTGEAAAGLAPSSEFGLYPDMLFASVRWYF